MSERMIAYVRDLPEGELLEWYSDSMEPGKDWEGPWVDVMVGDHLMLVIDSGLDVDENDAPPDFVWPPDMVGMHLVDPARRDPHVGVLPVPVKPFPIERLDEFLAEIAWAQEHVSPEAYWVGGPVWSAQEVNRAIEDWCMRHTGRAIQARWDAEHPLSPGLQLIQDQMEAIKAGIEPTYLLHPDEKEGGEGFSVYGTEQVMELLLSEMVEGDE